MPNEIDIAKAVLAKAKAIDPRMPQPDRVVLAAWADVFRGQSVWLTEALDGVSEHYRAENPNRLMPGDVIGYCKRQPVWSSRDHAIAFLDIWSRHPYSPVIEDFTGIRPPEIDDRGAYRDWVEAHRERLVDALIARRHEPLAIER
jgi:hypothetical protein